MKIIIVLLIGIAVYVLLKAVNALNKYIYHKYAKWTQKFNFVPAMEFIMWLIFIFWANDFLFKNKSYYQYLVLSLIVIVVVLLAWFIARDFIAGIVLRVQNDLQTNNNIQFGNTEGRIKSQHLTHLKIVTPTGQIVKIPYTRLNQEIVSEISDSTAIEEFKFQIQAKKTMSRQDMEEKIRFLLINSPWCNFNKIPVIRLISESEDLFVFEILVNALNQKHILQLEKSIGEQLSNMNSCI